MLNNYITSDFYYLRHIANYVKYTEQEQKELFCKLRSSKRGAKAIRDDLILHNLGLVFHIVKKYWHPQLEKSDLIQEGIVGLITAVDRYNVDKGAAFSTYAYFWIKQALQRAIQCTGNTIRKPSYFWENYYRFVKVKQEYMRKYDKEPSDIYLMTKLDISKYHIELMQSTIENKVSIDAFVTEPEFVTITPVFAGLSVEDVRNVLKFLDTQAAEVIKLYYGLLGADIHTLREIGKKYKLSHQRIQQIVVKSMAKLSCFVRKEARLFD